MANIFTYGSLMFDSVWSKVVDGSYDRTDAILQGYDRKAVRGEVYPVIVPSSAHSQVQGIVYRDVSSTDLVKLDQFEGEYYFRKTEQVVTEKAEVISAEIYVLQEEYYVIISHEDWDAERFSTTGIHYFIHNYIVTDEH